MSRKEGSRRSLPWWIAVTGAGMRLLASGSAIAADPAQASCAIPVERAISIDASLTMPRDRATGRVIHAIESSLPSPACRSADGPDAGWRLARVPHAAQAQDVHRTGLGAIDARLSIDGRVLSSTDVIAVPGERNGALGGTLRLELIKRDERSDGGVIRGADLPTLAYVDSGGTTARITFTGTIEVRSATCRTPDVRVILDPIAAAALPAVGASAGARSFELQFNDCAAGIDSIGYRLDPRAFAVDGLDSVLRIDDGPEGVAIQIRDGQGRPLSLGVTHPFTPADLATGGAFRIPLQAVYYRTGADPLQPGRISASMTFTMSYQ